MIDPRQLLAGITPQSRSADPADHPEGGFGQQSAFRVFSVFRGPSSF